MRQGGGSKVWNMLILETTLYCLCTHPRNEERGAGNKSAASTIGNRVYASIQCKRTTCVVRAREAGGRLQSLAHQQPGNHPVSHVQNKSPMRIKFKSAAIALALCLVLQVQADTVLGKVINVADTTWQQHEPADQSAPCAS